MNNNIKNREITYSGLKNLCYQPKMAVKYSSVPASNPPNGALRDIACSRRISVLVSIGIFLTATAIRRFYRGSDEKKC